MQTKTAMRYHLTPVRIATIKKSTASKCWRGRGEKQNLLQCRWEWKWVKLLWRVVWRFLKKLKIELPYDATVQLLGVCWEKNMVPKDSCTPMFIAALFTIVRTWKQPKCLSTNEWIEDMWFIYTIPLERWNNATDSYMDGRGDCCTEWSKSYRERSISHHMAYMWNLKNMVQMNLSSKQKQTHRLRKQTWLSGGQGWRGRKEE